jgi:hypothetical protein
MEMPKKLEHLAGFLSFMLETVIRVSEYDGSGGDEVRDDMFWELYSRVRGRRDDLMVACDVLKHIYNRRSGA